MGGGEFPPAQCAGVVPEDQKFMKIQEPAEVRKVSSKSAIERLRKKREANKDTRDESTDNVEAEQKLGGFVFLTPLLQRSPHWRDEN